MSRGVVRGGTRFVPAPAGGGVVDIFATDREVEILDQRWLRVRVGEREGYVRESALEPTKAASAATGEVAEPASAARGIKRFPREETAFVGDEILAHLDFHSSLRRLSGFAQECMLEIYVTHSFRRRDHVASGAVVSPAKRSNHLVGHAIDMNLVVGGQFYNSGKLRRENHRSLPPKARYFLQMIREDPILRWGGDFVQPDPVHIDDDLYRRDPMGWERKLAAL